MLNIDVFRLRVASCLDPVRNPRVSDQRRVGEHEIVVPVPAFDIGSTAEYLDDIIPAPSENGPPAMTGPFA